MGWLAGDGCCYVIVVERIYNMCSWAGPLMAFNKGMTKTPAVRQTLYRSIAAPLSK